MSKKLPEEWAKHFGFEIYDPDGWRSKVGELEPRPIDEPVSEQEFIMRAAISTINPVYNFPAKRYAELLNKDGR